MGGDFTAALCLEPCVFGAVFPLRCFFKRPPHTLSRHKSAIYMDYSHHRCRQRHAFAQHWIIQPVINHNLASQMQGLGEFLCLCATYCVFPSFAVWRRGGAYRSIGCLHLWHGSLLLELLHNTKVFNVEGLHPADSHETLKRLTFPHIISFFFLPSILVPVKTFEGNSLSFIKWNNSTSPHKHVSVKSVWKSKHYSFCWQVIFCSQSPQTIGFKLQGAFQGFHKWSCCLFETSEKQELKILEEVRGVDWVCCLDLDLMTFLKLLWVPCFAAQTFWSSHLNRIIKQRNGLHKHLPFHTLQIWSLFCPQHSILINKHNLGY